VLVVDFSLAGLPDAAPPDQRRGFP
jgi:hypothetical protein